jgi:hypothetical protein
MARWDVSLCSAREANGLPKFLNVRNGEDSGYWRDPAAAHD